MSNQVKQGEVVEGAIKASELIGLLEREEIVPVVSGGEDCSARLYSGTIEADEEGHCSIVCYYGYPEDSPQHGVDLGAIEFTVGGVEFSATRLAEDEHDRYQLGGRAIEYDNGLTEDDVVEAAEEHVDVGSCEYSCDAYEFYEEEVADEDIINAIETYPAYFVEDESGEILGFEDEEEIPEGCTELDEEEAIKRLVSENRDDIDFELWA